MRITGFVMAFCLAGCGGVIGGLSDLPQGADVSDAPWPRLVDTPEPPADRLMVIEGEQALERLGEKRTASAVRLARANTVPDVSATLLDRADRSRAASAGPGREVDEAALLARAERLRARASAVPVEPAPALAAPLRAPQPLRSLDTPVVTSDFEARARRALERAGR